MKNIYVSLMNAYDETKNINYNNLEKLLDYHKEIGNYNYFIGQYFFEKWSLSQKEKTKLNELIINKLDNEAKIIIDVSDAVYEKNLTIINDLNKKSDKIFLSINMPIDNNFSSNIIDHLYYFNNVTAEISKEFYINLNCNIIQYKRFREVLQNILKNKKIKGIIFNPNFFDDDEIKYITNANLSERNLDIICNSDEFYLEALKNNNSIISKYINVFSEYFLDIHDHYYNKQLTEAINLQENLNNKILKLSRYGDLQSIKYLFKLGKFDLGGVRNIYYQLNEEEKSKLKNNYFQS